MYVYKEKPGGSKNSRSLRTSIGPTFTRSNIQMLCQYVVAQK